MHRAVWYVVGVVCMTLVGAEAGLRIGGFIDTPVYDVDARTGYIPAANQSGSFLNTRDYAINADHMGTPVPFVPGPGLDVLLVGDSIVWGGNPYKAQERLAPQLQVATDAQVWPISAGSWSLVNQLNYLEDRPAVVAGSDRIVFILNQADFGAPSSWQNPLTHPRKPPRLALQYYVQKYLLKTQPPPTPAELVVPAEEPFAKLAAFLAECECEADFWIYPTKAQLLGTDAGPTAAEMRADMITRAGVEPEHVRLVQDISGWSADLYKDAIHPTPDGFGVLAQGIAATLPPAAIAAAVPTGG